MSIFKFVFTMAIFLLFVACDKSSELNGGQPADNSLSSIRNEMQDKDLKEALLQAEIIFGAHKKSETENYYWPTQIETLGCHYFNIMRETNSLQLDFIENKIPRLGEKYPLLAFGLRTSLDNYKKMDQECLQQCPTDGKLTCLKNYCAHAQGVWWDKIEGCLCDEGKIFSPRDGGACVSYESSTLSNGDLSIKLDNSNFFNLKKEDDLLLNELNLDWVATALYFNPTSTFFSSDLKINFSSDPETLKAELEKLSLKIPLAHYVLQDSYESYGTAYVFLPMQHEQFENQKTNLMQLSPEEQSWLNPVLNSWKEMAQGALNLSRLPQMSGITNASDCIHYCGLVYKLSENVFLTRYYSRGKVYFQTMDYMDQNQISRARAFINSRNQLIALQTLQINGLANTIAKFYDRELVLLSSAAQQLPKKHWATPIAEIKRDTIIACGDIYDDWYNQLLGPEDHSLSGWIKNPDKNLFLYTDGFKNYTLSGFDATRSVVEHGKAVHNILGTSIERPNIVMSALSCFNPDRWSSYLYQKPHGSYPLVRNLSFGIYSSVENCKMWNSHDHDFYKYGHLWVMGAGNVQPGSSHSQFFKNRSCLQMMSGKLNSLIVAATDDNQAMASYSVQGPEYADVAASGTTYFQGKKLTGTSFAAPKVSRLAADLSARYPELAHRKLIRYVIMFSPKLKEIENGFDFLPVRSGGAVDIDKANELALLMSQLSSYELMKLAEGIDTRKSPHIEGTKNSVMEELILKTHCRWKGCRDKLQRHYINGWLRLKPVGLLP